MEVHSGNQTFIAEMLGIWEATSEEFAGSLQDRVSRSSASPD